MQRDRIIIKTSLIGILANVFLAAFKAVVGLISGSIAITLDAVNNLSDALSSVITIIGTKLAGKKPDKKHPYGHGRIEYISTILISMIVLYAGAASLVESIKKILDPYVPDYSAAALIIVGAAVLVKIFLGRYVSHVGKKVHSDSLAASGKDALMDAVISASTLLAAAIFLIFGLNLEAWLAAAISLYIIKSGIEMLRDSLSQILGERVDSELSKKIKETVQSIPGIYGAYDLILHNYGPDRMIGSVHIEVADTLTMNQLYELESEVVNRVLSAHNVILAGISVYSHNTQNDRAGIIQNEIEKTVMAHDYVLQMHGFFLKEEAKTILFDIIIDYGCPDRQALYEKILAEIREKYPDYEIHIVLDADISD